MPSTVILNSFHFLDDILPELVIFFSRSENPPPMDVDVDQSPSLLWQVIIEHRHTIVFSDRGERDSIKRQYSKEAIKRGRGPILAWVLDQLQIRELATVNITNRLPRKRIQNLPGPHPVFIDDAVTANAEYLVTDRGHWQALDRHRRFCPQLNIVDADRFIRMSDQNNP